MLVSVDHIWVGVLLVCLFGSGSLPALTAAELRTGVGMRIVTPDPLLPVSGGVGPSHPVAKKEGDLSVRALVLDQGETRVAIVSSDFLGFPSALGDRVRTR